FMRRERETFRTFDSLRPDRVAADFLTLRMTPDGPLVKNVPPTFTTGPSTREDAFVLGDIGAALSRTPLITDDRKAHIQSRWEHWKAAPKGGIRRVGTGE